RTGHKRNIVNIEVRLRAAAAVLKPEAGDIGIVVNLKRAQRNGYLMPGASHDRTASDIVVQRHGRLPRAVNHTRHDDIASIGAAAVDPEGQVIVDRTVEVG